MKNYLFVNVKATGKPSIENCDQLFWSHFSCSLEVIPGIHIVRGDICGHSFSFILKFIGPELDFLLLTWNLVGTWNLDLDLQGLIYVYTLLYNLIDVYSSKDHFLEPSIYNMNSNK